MLLFVATLPYLWKLVNIIFMSPTCPVLRQLELYKWAACGCLAFLLLRRLLSKNLEWMETFTHELTHITVALLFLRKVHSFEASERTGVVTTSGSGNGSLAAQSLAPYCLPIYTYLLLSLRCLVSDQGFWIFDILIGITLAFHIHCFIQQTGSYQTDINKYPLIFSYTYIFTALLINLCVIIVAFFPQYNVFTSLWRYLTALFNLIISMFA